MKLKVIREFDVPESSMITDIIYHSNKELLVVEFHHSRVYEYYEVPISVIQSWIKTESTGKFFNENIKGTFSVKEITND